MQATSNNARNQLSEKNTRVTNVISEIDVADEDVKALNETARRLSQLADELNANATQIRQSDIKGAYELVEESHEKSRQSQSVITTEMDKINAAETERNKADQLLKQHQKDFDIQYEENQAALEDIGVTVERHGPCIVDASYLDC